MITPASTLAGEETLGSLRSETIESKIDSTDCVGFHLSSAFSPLVGSSPGACNMEMHNRPSGKLNEYKSVRIVL